ncbi:hypothetical protein ATB98_01670 [Sinorhizobium saheli]|uniref:Uncharacterized protein n=1 Tax=Sinorhizobium saheli TaxID=36856 RepID=A0A178XJJ0_SINSA|nr:hypothetical protein ATB98_01670 [Sinorhizobium saheli]
MAVVTGLRPASALSSTLCRGRRSDARDAWLNARGCRSVASFRDRLLAGDRQRSGDAEILTRILGRFRQGINIERPRRGEGEAIDPDGWEHAPIAADGRAHRIADEGVGHGAPPDPAACPI